MPGASGGFELGFGGHGRSKSDGSLVQQGGEAKKNGDGRAKTEGKHAVAASGDSGVVMAENERPEREVDLPEIVVSTPHGSREKAGRNGDAGSSGPRG